MNAREKAIIVLDLLGDPKTEENISAWLASGDQPARLKCGCTGKCDPFAHDTAPDWDGTPDGPGWTDLSEREKEQHVIDHPYCQECGDDLTAEDIVMVHRYCRECSEHPNDRCTECGEQCPEGDTLCGYCAQEAREIEDRVNERSWE